VLLDVQGVCYQVFVPPLILERLGERASPEGEVELVTFHYQQIEPSRGFHVLIGFTNEVEREFFERFITVSGVGPKAALRALTVPIPAIAKAIDDGDTVALKALPGIGEQRAREIVAKLQGKVGKFALIQSTGMAQAPAEAPKTTDRSALEAEATAVLLQLEYSRQEAKAMVEAALRRNPRLKNAEELLNEIWRQRSGEPAPAAPPTVAVDRPGRAKRPPTREPAEDPAANVALDEEPYAV
jgi:Holliday junction DNA helicase RuvA